MWIHRGERGKRLMCQCNSVLCELIPKRILATCRQFWAGTMIQDRQTYLVGISDCLGKATEPVLIASVLWHQDAHRIIGEAKYASADFRSIV